EDQREALVQDATHRLGIVAFHRRLVLAVEASDLRPIALLGGAGGERQDEWSDEDRQKAFRWHGFLGVWRDATFGRTGTRLLAETCDELPAPHAPAPSAAPRRSDARAPAGWFPSRAALPRPSAPRESGRNGRRPRPPRPAREPHARYWMFARSSPGLQAVVWMLVYAWFPCRSAVTNSAKVAGAPCATM